MPVVEGVQVVVKVDDPSDSTGPTDPLLTANSTEVIAPSGSEAVAVRGRVEPSGNVLLAAGLVRVMAGGVLGTLPMVTVRGVEAVAAPVVSTAMATQE